MKKILILSFTLASIISCFGQNYVWIQKADYNGGNRYGAFGFSIGSKGYTGAGVGFASPNFQYIYTDFWEYDQPTNTWSQKANIPGLCKKEAIGFTIGTKGYFTTGWTPSQSAETYEYDPVGNTWTPKANFGGGPRYTSSSFTIGNYAYVGLGFAPYYNDFWRYDPAIDTWTQMANVGGLPRQAASGFAIGNYGYIFGGDQQNTFYTNDLWKYDPMGNSWMQMTSCPCSARGASFSFAFGGKGFIGGGTDEVVTFQDFYEYDPITDSWTQRQNYGEGPIMQPFYFSIGNRGYVGSGSSAFYPNINLTNHFWEWGPSEKGAGINEGAQNYASNINVYVNDNVIHLNFSKEFNKNTLLKLFDVSGKFLKIYNIPSGRISAEFSVPETAKGILLYRLEAGNSEIKSGKIIVL